MTTRKSAVIPSDHVVPVLRLLRRALRFWWAGLLVLALGLAATAAAIQLRPKKYKSEAAVLYREGLQWGANEPLGARRVGPRLRELLLSRSQLGKVVEEMGLYPALVAAGKTPEAVEEMRLSTTFRYDQSDVFVISYSGSSPGEAQRVTARLTELLIAENARLRSEQAEVQREFLETEKNRKAEELAAKEAEQLRFLARHPEFAHEQTPTMGVTLRARSSRPSAAAALTGRTDTALAALRREEERLRRQISSPGQVAAAPVAPALLAAKAEAHAAMLAAQRELSERRAQFTEQHPDVRQAFALAADAEERHRRAAAAVEEAQAPVPVSVLRERLAAVQQEIAAQQRERVPQAAAGNVERSDAAKRIVAVETEWARLNREVAEARERLQALDTQQFMASMTATMLTGGQASQLVVIEPAYRPAHPVGASTKKLALFGVAAAMGLAMFLALALAAVDDLFYDGDDVERLNLAPVLAEVPRRWLPGRGRRRRRTDEDAAAAGKAPADARAPGTVREVRRIPRGLTRMGMRPALGPDTSATRGTPDAPRPPSTPLHPVEALAVRKGEAAAVPMVPESGDDGLSSTAFFARPGDTSEDLVRIHRLQTSGRVDARVLMLGAPDDPAAAAFRVLRHRLRERRGARVLLVTSPRPGEGKTSTAVNLALALGEEGGARVLLIEANFRRPSLAGVLGFQPPVCLGQQFELHRARPTAPWVVVETVPSWLHTATVAPEVASRGVLDGRALALFIEDMREAGYEYIVVDGPAILDGADANLIEERVDGILLTVRARRSRARTFRTAVDQIGAGKLLGVVVLGT